MKINYKLYSYSGEIKNTIELELKEDHLKIDGVKLKINYSNDFDFLYRFNKKSIAINNFDLFKNHIIDANQANSPFNCWLFNGFKQYTTQAQILTILI